MSLRAFASHLRWYKSAQMLVPGLLGFRSQRTWPGWLAFGTYGVAYFSHFASQATAVSVVGGTALV